MLLEAKFSVRPIINNNVHISSLIYYFLTFLFYG